MSAPAAAIDRLTLRAGDKTLLRDFSLTVAEGEKVALAGPSGCGKSTLLKCLLGLAEPAAGSIRLFGEELTSAAVWRLRARCSWVGQEPFPGHGTVRLRIDELFAYRANQPWRERRKLLPERMAYWQLGEELLDRDLSLLSGGEKQRFGLIVAELLARPLLLLDEPASALDPVNRARVAQLIRATDRAVIVVAHDAETAAAAGRRVAIDGGAV